MREVRKYATKLQCTDKHNNIMIKTKTIILQTTKEFVTGWLICQACRDLAVLALSFGLINLYMEGVYLFRMVLPPKIKQ